jgi:two-component system response regulator ResD
MESFKVLVVDDDKNVCDIIRLFFEEQQINMIEAHNGQEALDLVEIESPDIIILDVMMPKLDGFETCREIRKISTVPIIMLTAKTEEFDRVLGLELGADDYVTKPFSPRELVSRIKAIFRRMEPIYKIPVNKEAQEIYEVADLVVNVKRREVFVNDELVSLRPKEFDLLVHMIKSPGKVFTRELLLEQVWGYDFIGDIRTVDVHVKMLRKRLGPVSKCIQTVWGVGYKFEVIF